MSNPMSVKIPPPKAGPPRSVLSSLTSVLNNPVPIPTPATEPAEIGDDEFELGGEAKDNLAAPLKCPTCGSKSELLEMGNGPSAMYYIKCAGPNCGVRTGCEISKGDATAVWNQRPKKLPDKRIAELAAKARTLNADVDKFLQRISRCVIKYPQMFGASPGDNAVERGIIFVEEMCDRQEKIHKMPKGLIKRYSELRQQAMALLVPTVPTITTSPTTPTPTTKLLPEDIAAAMMKAAIEHKLPPKDEEPEF